MLLLKRASKSRPDGQWSDDDYDVFDGDQHIGRIMWTHAARGRSPMVLDDHSAGAAKAYRAGLRGEPRAGYGGFQGRMRAQAVILKSETYNFHLSLSET